MWFYPVLLTGPSNFFRAIVGGKAIIVLFPLGRLRILYVDGLFSVKFPMYLMIVLIITVEAERLLLEHRT